MTQRSRTAATPEPAGRPAGTDPLSPFLPPDGQRHSRSDARRASPRRRLPSAPFEGWLTLVLLGIMGATFGLSLDDARWVLGRDGLTDFLPFAVVGGVAWGFVAAKAEWGGPRPPHF